MVTGPLEGVRVLDLTDHRGELGPWLLAELGADVIKVEPSAGTPARSELPHRQGDTSDLRSLQFCAYNSNKRSVVVDLDDPGGRERFLEMVSVADFVYESGVPGVLAEAGIGRADLEGANPSIVHVQVTPYGLDGPRALDPEAEITIAALGGPANLQGVRERPPVKASVPQVWRHAGAESAVAGLVAHARMRTAGGAQHVDVSAQAVMTWTLLNAMEAHEIQGFDIERSGTLARLAIDLQLRHATSDGYVIAIPRGATIHSLKEWMVEEGVADERWLEEDWLTFDHRLLSGEGEPPKFTFDDVHRAIADLCAKYDRDTLMRKALALGETIAPVNAVDDLLELDHLEARETWVESQIGDVAPKLPAPHVSFDGTRPAHRRRPPHIGEHQTVVEAEIDAALAEVGERLTPVGVVKDRALPLEGVKVADFSWVGVGPISAKSLADHGATVVRIESIERLDPLRANPPFKDNVNDPNMSHFYATFNTSKLSIDIDLKKPEGLDIARRMIEWADLIIESWTPGAFGRLGFDDDTIRELNPGAIVVHTSLLASGGPLSQVAGYGYHAGAMAGFYEVVGWEDMPPDGPYLAYTDTISPRFIAPTMLAALARREQTGEGTVIEVAQLECGLQLLAPEFLDLQLNGNVAGRRGNRDLAFAPQGMYPCVGDDRWCAVSVPDDAAWGRVVAEMGSPDWAADPALATLVGRQAAHDEIDRHLGGWTAGQDADDLAARLNAIGVPAGKVQRSSDLLRDPQYAHREFYTWHEHPEMGRVPYAGHQYSVDGYDHGPRHAAPLLGQHTFDVLSDFLGMDPDEIAEAAIAGALGG